METGHDVQNIWSTRYLASGQGAFGTLQQGNFDKLLTPNP